MKSWRNYNPVATRHNTAWLKSMADRSDPFLFTATAVNAVGSDKYLCLIVLCLKLQYYYKEQLILFLAPTEKEICIPKRL